MSDASDESRMPGQERDGTLYADGIPEGVIYDFITREGLADSISQGYFAWADGWDGRRLVNTRKGIERANAVRAERAPGSSTK